jgi:hypothetical protein
VCSHVFEGCNPKLGKFFQNPHTMKLVYYRTHHNIIGEVIKRFLPHWKPDLAAFVAALVFCSKTSKCLQHFWHACWKMLSQGAGVLTISIRSPEYPGLDESEECASWSILHWISRLD